MRRDLQSTTFSVPPAHSPAPAGTTRLRAGGVPAVRAAGPGPVPRRLPRSVLAGLGLAAGAVLGGAVWAATHLHADPALRTGALFVHLICLVVSFGAVLAVDWFALLWLLGRQSLVDLTKVGAAAHLPIWLGLLGLVLSGALLRPDLSQPLTWLKLVLVLVVTLNGLRAYAIGDQLARFPAVPVPYWLLRRAMGAAAVSQLGWWGATVIGFLNAQQ